MHVNQFRSIIIADTTREERERIVAEYIGNINGSCDGCMTGLIDTDQDDVSRLMSGDRRSSCPFFRDGDEYKVVRHQ